MNRWRQLLEAMEPDERPQNLRDAVAVRKAPAERGALALDAGTLLLCQARNAGCPRLRLQAGVYVCEGLEAWRRFVRTAEPEWLAKAERALGRLISADKPEGSHDGH